MDLIDITAGQRLSGIVPYGTVTVVAVEHHGIDAATVTYRSATGSLGERVLYAAEAASITPAFGTIRPFDAAASDFKLAAEAQRIRLAGTFDPMLAVATSDVRPLPHQIQAVYGELLDRIPLRFLLADDPGAGKTIMAGLYIKELKLRDDVHRCLIVAPGGLVEQWQDELFFKFGLRFEILNPADVLNNPAEDAFEDHRLVIARMDQLARNDDLLDRLASSAWDLTVVDEAHRMAAHYYGMKVDRTRRFELGELLGKVSRHFLLMTATPHAGKEEDFQLFLSLLDRDLFEGRYREGLSADTRSVMRRMVKEDLLTMEGKPLFPQRVAETVPYELTGPEQQLYDDVTAYVREGMNRADRLEGKRRNTVGFALTVLQRRLASSPEAIYQSLRRRAARLAARRQEMLTGRARDYEAEYASEVDLDDEFATGESEALEEELVDAASAARTVEELDREIAELQLLVASATAVRRSGQDRKWAELRSILEGNVLGSDPAGTPRKLIVFTEHKDTLDYLTNRISGLLGGHAVVAIHGGVNRAERRRITEEFSKNPIVQVLIATDAAGEGLNLQAAHLMVNYDLPWNPNRIEQRFGRIHRIGQTEVCRLWNLVATTTREGQVYESLLGKVEKQRTAYGGKVFDVLGAAFTSQPLRDLLITAIREGERPETRAYLEQVIDASVAHGIEELLAERALSATRLEDADVAEIQRRMDEARARRLQPHYIETAFREAFTRLGGRIVRRERGRFEITNVPVALRRRGTGPIATRYERVTFELPRVRPDGLTDADLLAPGHPLHDAVMVAAAETWRPALERGTVLVSTDVEEPVLLVGVEEEVVDGTGEIIARRFGHAYVSAAGRVCPAGPAPYLDCVAAPPGRDTTTALSAPWLAGAEQQATTWMIGHDLPAYLADTTARRRAELERTRALVRQRLTAEINRLYGEATVAQDSLVRGTTVKDSPEALTRKAEDLEQRLSDRLTTIDAQLHMTTKPPRLVMAALVLPYQEVSDQLPVEAPIHAVATKEVERRAVDLVMATERRLGRIPEEQAFNNPGFDIRSQLPDPVVVSDDGAGRSLLIEVKGRLSGATDFSVTHREVNTGRNVAPAYRLALVDVSPDGPEHDQVRYLDNPFAHVELGGLDVDRVAVKWAQTWAKGRPPF